MLKVSMILDFKKKKRVQAIAGDLPDFEAEFKICYVGLKYFW